MSKVVSEEIYAKLFWSEDSTKRKKFAIERIGGKSDDGKTSNTLMVSIKKWGADSNGRERFLPQASAKYTTRFDNAHKLLKVLQGVKEQANLILSDKKAFETYIYDVPISNKKNSLKASVKLDADKQDLVFAISLVSDSDPEFVIWNKEMQSENIVESKRQDGEDFVPSDIDWHVLSDIEDMVNKLDSYIYDSMKNDKFIAKLLSDDSERGSKSGDDTYPF